MSLTKKHILSYHFKTFEKDKINMAEHRPHLTLLSLIEQALLASPQGLPPRAILDILQEKGETISRPSLNRLLSQGVEKGVWSPVGEGRSVMYIPGTTPTSSLSTATEQPMSKTNKSQSSTIAEAPQNIRTQIRSVVWAIADTLRDKTQLQVESYQPVTLALMELKRKFDIQREELAEGGRFWRALVTEVPLVEAGFRDAKDVASRLNNELGFWSPSLLQGERFGLPLMTWEDFVNFKDSSKSGVREEGYTMVLRANPPGHQTPETALWTYTTHATDLKALMLEIIDSLTPDLKEMFGGMGAHNVFGPRSVHSATLSNTNLRDLCTAEGDGKSRKFGLANFDLGLHNISSDVFADTYMDLLGRFAEDGGKKGGEYFTPPELVKNVLLFSPVEEFAQQLSDNPNLVIRLGDPTSGSNTFLVKGYQAITACAEEKGMRIPSVNQFAFYSQELKSTQAALGIGNMSHYGLVSRLNPTEAEIHMGRSRDQGGIFSRINANVITEYVPKIGQQSGKLDWVLANPPYGTDDYGIVYATAARNSQEDRRWVAGVPTRSEGEWAFIQTIVDLLNPNGRATIVVPLGALFREGGQVFRQWLIEKDWVEAVISTPSNQFLTTSIPVALLLLNKNKKKGKDGVYFINASNDFTKRGKFNHWDVEKSLAAWKGREEIAHYSGFVSTDRLKKNKYSLAVNRYFAPPTEKTEYSPRDLNDDLLTIMRQSSVRTRWLFGENGDGGVFGQAQKAWEAARSASAESDDVDVKPGDGNE